MKPLSALADDLKKTTIACRVSFNWLGTRKTFNANERSQAAAPFDADHRYVSASKKLFDTKHPAFAKLTGLRNDVTSYWKAITLPYVEDGVRLLKRTSIESFNAKMQEFKSDFDNAVQGLDDCLGELKAEAAKRLGKLYDPGNYPLSAKQHFGLEWDFPSIEPPDHLKEMAPNVFEQEKERIAARLEEAVQLAQTAFLAEFQQLVANLHERLTPEADGKKKVFKAATIGNLVEFFTKFKMLHLGGNEDLEKLVNDAEELVKGIEPGELREHDLLRKQIAEGLQAINGKLEPMVTTATRRKLILPKKEPANEAA